MPSFILAVEEKPIVLSAYFGRVTEKDLQENYSQIAELIKKYGQIWLVLDLSAWEINYTDLLVFVETLGARVNGSPYDLAVISLLVCPDSIRMLLQTALSKQQMRLEMQQFSSLNEAYQYALSSADSKKHLD